MPETVTAAGTQILLPVEAGEVADVADFRGVALEKGAKHEAATRHPLTLWHRSIVVVSSTVWFWKDSGHSCPAGGHKRHGSGHVRAERTYAASHQSAGQPPQYAQYVQSTPGQNDGPWWDAATAAKAGPSPLATFASANQEFLEGRKPGDAFRGYYFRILTAQGPDAPGGTRGYLQPDGKRTGGFRMIAWPAAWRESGVMTFLVGPDDKVLQQDLGPETQSVVDGIRAYDPGPGWVPAESRSRRTRH